MAVSMAVSIGVVRASTAAHREVDGVRADGARDSHHESVAYMLTPEFAEVRELFEAVPEIGGVYTSGRSRPACGWWTCIPTRRSLESRWSQGR
jgi:hypothetical protein